MESELKIRYHIYDIFGEKVETDSHYEALAADGEGKIVYEIHETVWKSGWISGKNIVEYEWS